MQRLLFHITTTDAWESAWANGAYAPPSLAAEGFIHLSERDQVIRVANLAFRGTPDLVLLCIAPDRLESRLVYEAPEGEAERFPHLYGPLNLDAVAHVLPFVEGPDGFALPAEIR